MRKRSQAQLDQAKIATGLWEMEHPKISVRLEPEQLSQMQTLAKKSGLKTSEVVGKLLAYALEKLAQQQKQSDGRMW